MVSIYAAEPNQRVCLVIKGGRAAVAWREVDPKKMTEVVRMPSMFIKGQRGELEYRYNPATQQQIRLPHGKVVKANGMFILSSGDAPKPEHIERLKTMAPYMLVYLG